MKIVGFDLEIAKVVPQGEKDWDKHRPLGISCAAITITLPGGDMTYIWPHPAKYDPKVMLPSKLPIHEVDNLIRVLWDYHIQGYHIVTWNGLKFDFAILAEEGSMPKTCKKIAFNHIDIGFQMLCERGYMIGLDTAAKGLDLPGKTEGMHGALAPVMWAKDRASQDKVLEYVGQDARTTAEVYDGIMETGHVPWIAKSGRLNYWRPGIVVIASAKGDIEPRDGGYEIAGFYMTDAMETRLLTVKEALKLRLPDTNWMDDPISRRSCYEWTGYKL